MAIVLKCGNFIVTELKNELLFHGMILQKAEG